MTTTMNIDKKTLGAHVLCTLLLRRGMPSTAEMLAEVIGVRRSDVREIVSALHREGFVDAQRMRLTLSGFALATSLRAAGLRDVRIAERAWEQPATYAA